MDTTDVTLGELVDRAQYELEDPAERGRRVAIAEALTTNSTQFTLSSGALNVTDLIEVGSEMLLVTAKSGDATPTYTVARGYYGTTPAASAINAVAIVNPEFPRRRIAEAIDRSFTRIESLGLKLIKVERIAREAGLQRLELPTDCRQVFQVLYTDGTAGRILEVDRWQEFSNVSTTTSSTGRVLELPFYIEDSDTLEVVYASSIGWDSTGDAYPLETATVTLPTVAVDLPAAYAAAWLQEAREVSRQELDRTTEWTAQEQGRLQSGVGLTRLKWQSFYRGLDEAIRTNAFETPRHRPVVTRPRLTRTMTRRLA